MHKCTAAVDLLDHVFWIPTFGFMYVMMTMLLSDLACDDASLMLVCNRLAIDSIGPNS